MHYLHAALSETLRLYPAVPLDAKHCMSDDTLPDGFEVKKGDLVSYQPFAMGRMKFLWGEDAEEFRPERWLNEGGNFEPVSPFKFTASRQMKIIAAMLLYFFKFESSAHGSVNYRSMLTLQIDGGLCIRAMHR
ncbi:hypothetical protein HPP92_022252 [Vanilla planifolia]|uniref:noroxomaritidine synthase n=1 Tax=Vanilla planifolia TaxID=51239 RepID=A0A835PR56_VANPL|nr:hypothetical protein HPP92_022252 [Vanilla planifolia]